MKPSFGWIHHLFSGMLASDTGLWSLATTLGVGQDAAMPESSTVPRFLELSVEECMVLLATSPVGRIGVSIGALPVILPVNFIVFEGDVILRTVPGTKLQAATTGSIVAFEVDGYDAALRSGWSVLIQGRASEISDDGEVACLSSLPLESWALDGHADRWVRIEASIVTGRRFSSPSES
jgi:nitroimidazol reductase NimA-like FMN-containing flavoprotein (pyridoxamine 5'-phosphate oxidase superfamily)